MRKRNRRRRRNDGLLGVVFPCKVFSQNLVDEKLSACLDLHDSRSAAIKMFVKACQSASDFYLLALLVTLGCQCSSYRSKALYCCAAPQVIIMMHVDGFSYLERALEEPDIFMTECATLKCMRSVFQYYFLASN